jgi:hypothetical protein
MNPLDAYARSVVDGQAPAERMATIYVLCDSREADPIKRVRYVGQTVMKLHRRMRRHWEVADRGERTYRAAWMREVRNNGGQVLIEPVACVPAGTVGSAEIEYIAKARAAGCPLTNATLGGDGVLGCFPNEATRQKMREARRVRVMGDETRMRLSAAARRRTYSQETREKMRLAHIGLQKSPDTCKKLSDSLQGHVISQETRAKISASHLARGRKTA